MEPQYHQQRYETSETQAHNNGHSTGSFHLTLHCHHLEVALFLHDLSSLLASNIEDVTVRYHDDAYRQHQQCQQQENQVGFDGF